MGASADDTFNALGVLGGVILATSLLPQIYLAHKRRSTKDISYIWQVSCVEVGVFFARGTLQLTGV